MQQIVTKNSKETFELGKKFGSSLKGREIIAFSGEMGAGKTTFIQGMAQGIGIKNRIVSPTFILMRKYTDINSEKILYHLDLYRLEGDIKVQVRDLGLFDIWMRENNIVAIEWAEKLKNDLPKETIWIKFENIGENERRIKLSIA